MNASIYQDDGHVPNDSAIGGTIQHVVNTYDASRWKITGYGVKTDNPSHTWCRAPGKRELLIKNELTTNNKIYFDLKMISHKYEVFSKTNNPLLFKFGSNLNDYA